MAQEALSILSPNLSEPLLSLPILELFCPKSRDVVPPLSKLTLLYRLEDMHQ